MKNGNELTSTMPRWFADLPARAIIAEYVKRDRFTVPKDELSADFLKWIKENKIPNAEFSHVRFAKILKQLCPSCCTTRPRFNGGRQQCYSFELPAKELPAAFDDMFEDLLG